VLKCPLEDWSLVMVVYWLVESVVVGSVVSRVCYHWWGLWCKSGVRVIGVTGGVSSVVWIVESGIVGGEERLA
jgi:hypothetical protein